MCIGVAKINGGTNMIPESHGTLNVNRFEFYTTTKKKAICRRYIAATHKMMRTDVHQPYYATCNHGFARPIPLIHQRNLEPSAAINPYTTDMVG